MAQKNTDLHKYNTIKKLVQLGARGDEWQEAGLLRAIEKVIDSPDETVWSSDKIDALLKEAEDF